MLSVIGPAAAELVLGGAGGPEHSHREVTSAASACLAVTTDLGVDLLVPRDRDARGCSTRSKRGVEPVTEAGRRDRPRRVRTARASGAR